MSEAAEKKNIIYKVSVQEMLEVKKAISLPGGRKGKDAYKISCLRLETLENCVWGGVPWKWEGLLADYV